MQDAFVRILLQRGAGRVAGGFNVTVLILSFSPATVSGWLGDFVDEAKLYVLSTWSRWGVHSVLAGFCLAVNVLYHFPPLCPLPWAHAFAFMSRILPLPVFPGAWPRPVHLWAP